MDIQEIISKIRSPETLSERFILVALGIYCVSRALLSFMSFVGLRSIFSPLLYLTALFGVVLGIVVIIKMGGKIKDDFLRLGFLGLGLWLIAGGLSVFIPSAEVLYFIGMAFSFGAGALIMIGAINRDVVMRSAGLFVLGLYLFLNVATVMVNVFFVWDEHTWIYIGFGLTALLFTAGLFLMLWRSNGVIIEEDIGGDAPTIE